MWTSQLFHLGIVVIALLSKVAVSQQDDSTLQGKSIDQLYKDYFEWKYTVWSPEAGKISWCFKKIQCTHKELTVIILQQELEKDI